MVTNWHEEMSECERTQRDEGAGERTGSEDRDGVNVCVRRRRRREVRQTDMSG